MPSFDLTPRLIGDTLTLRPLQQSDFKALFSAASDPIIWQQHPDSLRYQRDVFTQRFFNSAIANGALAIIENTSGNIIGSTRFYDYQADARDVAIGFTFMITKHWGDGSNQEMKALMFDHAFKTVDRIWFHIAKMNARSCAAIEKLGAVLDHEEPAKVGDVDFVKLFYRLDK